MIVKNEAPVIARCLESVRPLISSWIIVDTGSSDGTQDIVRGCLNDIAGVLYEREWKNFAHNRSEALELARGHAAYSLVIDADDELRIPAGFELPPLTLDSYAFDIIDNGLRYPRTQLVSNSLRWFYRGVLHEFITVDAIFSSGHLPIEMVRGHDGARRRDPFTYKRDAEILSEALKTEPDPWLQQRYTFYLAQSYRDCQETLLAIETYLMRAEMGGWEEEVFYSLYQVAKLKEALGHDDDDVLAFYQRASAAHPRRNEARFAASRLCRIRKRYAEGYEFAKPGLGLQFPAGSLFGEPWVYHMGIWDEFAVNAYWLDKNQDCIDGCLQILLHGGLDQSNHQRVVTNLLAAWERVNAIGKSEFLRLSAEPRLISSDMSAILSALASGRAKDDVAREFLIPVTEIEDWCRFFDQIQSRRVEATMVENRRLKELLADSLLEISLLRERDKVKNDFKA